MISLLRGRTRLVFAVTLALAVFFFFGAGRAASANMAKWWHDGAGHGPLVPEHDTSVRVDSEDLAFEIAPSLDRADVTATYRMTNASAAATSEAIAFVVVTPEEARAGDDPPKASITVDGAPVPFTVVTDADVLGPALDDWLAAHPEIEAELARLASLPQAPRYTDYAALNRHVPACNGECDELVRWFRGRGAPKGDADRGRTILEAAEVAVPASVTKLHGAWSRLATHRRLSWLAFHVDFSAGQATTVTVRYTHRAGDDASRNVNQTFTYDYLLSPAKNWAHFGSLHLTIHAPPDTQVHASLPITRDGDTYRGDYPALPEVELSLDVMTRKGLIFGMTQPSSYWTLLLVVTTIFTIVVSVGLGRVWSRASTRLQRFLRCLLGTGPLVAVADALLVWLAVAAFPERAFGIGYESSFGLILLVLGAAGLGVVVSVLSARTRDRASLIS